LIDANTVTIVVVAVAAAMVIVIIMVLHHFAIEFDQSTFKFSLESLIFWLLL